MFKVSLDTKTNIKDVSKIYKNLDLLSPYMIEKFFYEDIHFINHDMKLPKYGRQVKIREQYNNDLHKAYLIIGNEFCKENELEIDNSEDMTKILNGLGYFEKHRNTKEENNIYLRYKSCLVKIKLVRTSEDDVVFITLETEVENTEEKDKVIHNLSKLIEDLR